MFFSNRVVVLLSRNQVATRSEVSLTKRRPVFRGREYISWYLNSQAERLLNKRKPRIIVPKTVFFDELASCSLMKLVGRKTILSLKRRKNTCGCFLFVFFNKLIGKRLTMTENHDRFSPLPNERKRSVRGNTEPHRMRSV